MKKVEFIGALLLASVVTGTTVFAQEATLTPGALPILYVGRFAPIEQSGSGFGPLHALNADIHRIKADSNASSLSASLVEAFRKRQLQAEKLPTDLSQQPHSGWAIQGIFYALDENARLIAVPLLTSQKGPNVEVSVTISDCAGDTRVPFAIIGTKAALKGQGTAISWNPYVAAAKFAVHQVRGEDSLATLADQIAQKIVEQSAQLLTHDPPTARGPAGP
jgi:hypothetical protein